jgi:hypothetical protein
MVGRVKFQVWGKYGWCTAYVRYGMLHQNLTLMRAYGIKCRVVEEAT